MDIAGKSCSIFLKFKYSQRHPPNPPQYRAFDSNHPSPKHIQQDNAKRHLANFSTPPTLAI
jgi:hypothetical protein